MTAETNIKIEIRDLTMASGSFVVMRDINALIRRGEVFIIMGGSGCGKSTLLRHMIGLKQPAKGDIYYDGTPYWQADDAVRQEELRSFGVLFQGGAMWRSMTLAENIGLVLGDTTGTQVMQKARFALLDRVLGIYGPQTAELRGQLHALIEESTRRLWPDDSDIPAGWKSKPEIRQCILRCPPGTGGERRHGTCPQGAGREPDPRNRPASLAHAG